MNEKKVFIIGLRKIHSTKKDTDYYMIDYAKSTINGWIPKTDYVDVKVYNTITKKAKIMDYNMAIFEEDSFDKLVIVDIKA